MRIMYNLLIDKAKETEPTKTEGDKNVAQEEEKKEEDTKMEIEETKEEQKEAETKVGRWPSLS